MIDFTNTSIYLWLGIAIGIIVIIVFAVKLLLLRKQKQDDVAPNVIDLTSDLPSGKKKKPRKAEAKIIASKTARKVEDEDEGIKFFNSAKAMPKLSLAYLKTWYLDKYHPGSIILINMELTNGLHRSFVVKEKEEGFLFRGKKYLFDNELKYYNIDARLYAFSYHEGLVLPVKMKIPVTQIKKTLESTEEIDTEYAINPSTLQRFMTAKIAEGIMKGTQLDEFMRKLQMFLIVTMVSVLVHLALFIYASGMLKNIRVPGLIG